LIHQNRVGNKLGRYSSHSVSMVSQDDGEVIWLQRRSCSEHMPEQGNTGELVKNLRRFRLHPGALTGSENHHRERLLRHNSI
jgi:hypothetical protein